MAATGRQRGEPDRLIPLRPVPVEPANPALRATGTFLATVMQVFTRRQWSHPERIPRAGGVVVVVNHISNADPLALSHFLVYAGRWPHFLAKSSLFSVPVVGAVLRRCGQIPVVRGTRDATNSLSAAVTAIEQGLCVVIYPEGTITKDPGLWPMRGKTGAARLALLTGAPVVPVAQWGAQEILYGSELGIPRLLPRATMRIEAGEPIPLDDLRQLPVTAESLREATERIMSALTDLLAGLRREAPPSLRFQPPPSGGERS